MTSFQILSRPYKSRSQRPCDFCRRRKSCCIIDGSLPCKLCRQYNKDECTFLEGPIARTRKNSSTHDKVRKRTNTKDRGKIRSKAKNKIRNKTKAKSTVASPSIDTSCKTEDEPTPLIITPASDWDTDKEYKVPDAFMMWNENVKHGVRSPKSTPLIPNNLNSKIPELNLESSAFSTGQKLSTTSIEVLQQNQTLLSILQKTDLEFEQSFKNSKRNKKFSVSSSCSSAVHSTIESIGSIDSIESVDTNASTVFSEGFMADNNLSIGSKVGSSDFDDYYCESLSNLPPFAEHSNQSSYTFKNAASSSDILNLTNQLSSYHLGLFERYRFTDAFSILSLQEIEEIAIIQNKLSSSEIIGYLINCKSSYFNLQVKTYHSEFYSNFTIKLIIKLLTSFISEINTHFPILSSQQLKVFKVIKSHLWLFNSDNEIFRKFDQFFPVGLISIIMTIVISSTDHNEALSITNLLYETPFKTKTEIQLYLLNVSQKSLVSNTYHSIQINLLKLYFLISCPSYLLDYQVYTELIDTMGKVHIDLQMAGLYHNSETFGFSKKEIILEKWEHEWRNSLSWLAFIFDSCIRLVFSSKFYRPDYFTGKKYTNGEFNVLCDLALVISSYLNMNHSTTSVEPYKILLKRLDAFKVENIRSTSFFRFICFMVLKDLILFTIKDEKSTNEMIPSYFDDLALLIAPDYLSSSFSLSDFENNLNTFMKKNFKSHIQTFLAHLKPFDHLFDFDLIKGFKLSCV